MLPIVSTPSAIPSRKILPKTAEVFALSADSEVLSGEWQRATQQKSNANKSRTLDGELVRDMQAVNDYLSAAGELSSTATGQLLSVYA